MAYGGTSDGSGSVIVQFFSGGVRERPGNWKLADKHAVAVVFIPCEQA